MIGAERARDLLRLQARLERGIVTSDDADEVDELLRKALGLTGLVVTDSWSYAGWNRVSGIDEGWAHAYEQVKHMDSSRDALLGAPPGTFWLLHRDAPAQDFKTPLYEAFLAHGMIDSAVVRVPTPFKAQIVVGFYRHKGLGRYTSDDVQLFSLVYPHLVGALGTRRALDAIDPSEAESPPGDLTAASAYAAISYPRRAIAWSVGARRLFTDRLGPVGERGWRRLDRAVLRAATRFYAATPTGRSQGLPGGIRAELAYAPPNPGESRRVLLLFSEEPNARPLPDGTARTPAEELLSSRQRQVARLAARGESAEAIAVVLEMSAATVRHHMRLIYERLGVSTRAELGALVEER